MKEVIVSLPFGNSFFYVTSLTVVRKICSSFSHLSIVVMAYLLYQRHPSSFINQ